MERTVKKRQSKSQPLRIVRLIKAALGIGRAKKRKDVREARQGFGTCGYKRQGVGAFGKCKYLKGKERHE